MSARKRGTTAPPNGPHPCPVCGVSSWLQPDLDLFMHGDGSANVECWSTILQGRAAETAGAR